jgi:putative FmdB family regulatory protein
MPTYEYRCGECGQHVEVVQSFADPPLTECGSCGGPLRKVFAPVGIVFKGSGFYKTDNRAGRRAGPKEHKEPAKESSPSKEASSKESSSSASAGSSSSDTKIA